MAISLGTETATLTIDERTWRIELFCEKGQSYIVRAHREKIWTNDAGEVVMTSRDIPIVERTIEEIASQEFTVNNVTLNGVQLAGIISGVCDQLRTEDIAKPPSSNTVS